MNRIIVQNKKQGFAILFAILLASLLLVIGLSIYNISVKELVISSFETEVKKAVYAATAGFECMNLWESPDSYGKAILATTTIAPPAFYDKRTGSGVIKCGDHFDLARSYNGNYDVDKVAIGFSTTSEFWMYLEPEEYGPCVHAKLVDEKITDKKTRSILTVWGYNSCDLGDKRTVEKQYEFRLRQ